MKIYTKGGDKGHTSLLSGKRVPKSNLRIEAYGTIDELNSHLGLLRDKNISTAIKEDLLHIQKILFVVGSILSCEVDPETYHLARVREADVAELERGIDTMEKELPVLNNFILPGGHEAVSQCHISRCVCRRAERFVVLLHEEEHIDEVIIQYLNRLSDYLFVLARKIGHDLGIKEINWSSPNR
jgi:cob(I)alamin adenosyltransferase